MSYFLPVALGQNMARLRRLSLWAPAVLLMAWLPMAAAQAHTGDSKDKVAADVIRIDLDALSKATWTAQERENAELITDFIQHIMNDHDFEWVMQKHGEDNYVQHNRNLAEGIPGVIESVEGIVKRFPEYTYDVKKIYVDGDFVIFHSHVTMKEEDRGDESKGLIITDTWRVVDGEIREHWDAIQPLDGSMRFFTLMNGGKIRNTNSIF